MAPAFVLFSGSADTAPARRLASREASTLPGYPGKACKKQ